MLDKYGSNLEKKLKLFGRLGWITFFGPLVIWAGLYMTNEEVKVRSWFDFGSWLIFGFLCFIYSARFKRVIRAATDKKG